MHVKEYQENTSQHVVEGAWVSASEAPQLEELLLLAIVKYEPFRSFFDWEPFNMLERFFDNQPLFSDTRTPVLDIKENDKSYIFTFEMPGLKKDAINVSIEDRILRVKGERKEEIKDEKNNFLRQGRFYSKFESAYRLPDDVADKVNATYKDGLLELVLDKVPTEKVETKKIEIK